jgi:hypothetical protein
MKASRTFTLRDSDGLRRDASPPRLAWALVLLAAWSFEIAAGDGNRSPALLIAIAAGEAAAVWAVWRLARGFAPPAGPSRRTLGIFLAATTAFGVEIAWRTLVREMLPFELLLLSLVRNGILFAAALARTKDQQHSVCTLSTFLMIFSAALSSDRSLPGLVIAFAVMGVWWLLGSYWETMRDQMAAASACRLPRRWCVTLPLLVASVLALVPLAGGRDARAAGFHAEFGGQPAVRRSGPQRRGGRRRARGRDREHPQFRADRECAVSQQPRTDPVRRVRRNVRRAGPPA